MKKLFLLSTIALSSFFISCSDSDKKEDGGQEVPTNPQRKLKVVVAVLDSNGNAINVQQADANTTKDYVMVGSKFQHRVLIEDFTGAWCGWCPRVTASIEELEKSNADKIVPVALHNGDKLAFSPYERTLSDALWTKFGIPTTERGYPFAVLNRSEQWDAKSGNAMKTDQVLALAKADSEVGIKISSQLEATSGKINVSFKFANGVPTELKYVVYVVESGIVLKQSNYTSNYGGKGNKDEFVHNEVAKAVNGDVMGVTIPSDKIGAGKEFATGDISVSYKEFK